MPELLPPQLVVNCRMMFLSYVPAGPGAIDEALPAGLGLTPVESRAVVLVHYVVDQDEQTSGFGPQPDRRCVKGPATGRATGSLSHTPRPHETREGHRSCGRRSVFPSARRSFCKSRSARS